MSITRKDFLKGAAGMAALGAAGAVAAAAPMALAEEAGTGTATATVPGFGGDVSVTLTLEGGKVVDCAIVGDGETPALGGRAVAQMPAQYVEAGSLDVDGVTGATVTSTAIKSAARLAYNEIMGIAAGEVHMKPGTYTASSMGYWDVWDLPVTITVDEHCLLSIEVSTDRKVMCETETMMECVKETLFPRMIKYQSVAVDGASGATVTSNAVKAAVEKALTEALIAGGSDASAISHFYNNPGKTELGEVEEFSVDLLVVGLSTAGVLAMKSASETFLERNGRYPAKVFGVEKAAKLGGQSINTHSPNAVNPSWLMNKYNNGQQLVDRDEYYATWLQFTTGADGTQKAKPEVIDLFCEESGKTIDWMIELEGIRFGAVNDWKEGHDFSTSTFATEFSYFSDKKMDHFLESNEDRRAAMNSYYKKLLTEVKGAGGGYLMETEAYEYLYDDQTGSVTGVKARNVYTGKEYIIHANAVISNTGGYGQNEELMNTLLPGQLAGMWKQNGNTLNDGVLFKSGLDIGAGTWNADMPPICMEIGLPYYMKHFPLHETAKINSRIGRAQTWTYNDIPLYLCVSCDSLAVNPAGERVCNEYGIGNGLGDHVPPETWVAGPYFYSIWSQEQIDALAANGFSKSNVIRTAAYCQQGGFTLGEPLGDVMYEAMDAAIDEGLAWKGETLADLAATLGMDAAVLEGTVARYNAQCVSGVDEDFGKDAAWLNPVGFGPYYAVKAMNVMYGTGGGYDIDTQLRVLKADHATPINGLYATGQDSFGVLANNEKNYLGYGGVCQGWVITSGRLAGINAANYVYDTFGTLYEAENGKK